MGEMGISESRRETTRLMKNKYKKNTLYPCMKCHKETYYLKLIYANKSLQLSIKRLIVPVYCVGVLFFKNPRLNAWMQSMNL